MSKPTPPRHLPPPQTADDDDDDDSYEDEDENDPFADRNAVTTPKIEKGNLKWGS